jgi:hypothetical protein
MQSETANTSAKEKDAVEVAVKPRKSAAAGMSPNDSKYQITTYMEMPSNGRARPAQVQVSHKTMPSKATTMWMILNRGNAASAGRTGMTPAAVRASDVKRSGEGLHIEAVDNSSCRK